MTDQNDTAIIRLLIHGLWAATIWMVLLFAFWTVSRWLDMKEAPVSTSNQVQGGPHWHADGSIDWRAKP